MKLLKILLASAIISGTLFSLATGKMEYSKKEGKKCVFCHVKMGSKELNDAGKYYKEHNHSLEGYKAPKEQEK